MKTRGTSQLSSKDVTYQNWKFYPFEYDQTSGKQLTMSKVQVNTEAPDFVLNDFDGEEISLSNYRNTKKVLLVFNRGFI